MKRILIFIITCLFLSCNKDLKVRIANLEQENAKLKDSIFMLKEDDLLNHKFILKIDTTHKEDNLMKLKIRGRLFRYTNISPLYVAYQLNGDIRVLEEHLDVTEFFSEIDNVKTTDTLEFVINSIGNKKDNTEVAFFAQYE